MVSEKRLFDLINKYKKKGNLKASLLGRGGAWLDTGSIDDFYKTSAFVSAIEKRQGLKVACIEEIALSNGWINEIEINTNNRILNSLRFRKAYGGMRGDMNMIEYYTQLVYYDKIKLGEEKIPLVKITMEPLLKKDWIYQANDFHCNRSIIQQINNYFPNYDKEYLKKLIWNFSSSQNNRIYIEKDKKQEEDWEKIQRVVKRVQKSCIYY